MPPPAGAPRLDDAIAARRAGDAPSSNGPRPITAAGALFPPTATIESMEAVEATTLVDGLALATHARGGATSRSGTKGLPATTDGDHAAADRRAGRPRRRARRRGRRRSPPRASTSSCWATRSGPAPASTPSPEREVPPPELEFARTPRSGTSLTHAGHRAGAERRAARLAGRRQVRAAAEPALAPLGRRRCSATRGDPRRRAVWRRRRPAGCCRRASCGSTPPASGALDVLAMVDEAGGAAAGAGAAARSTRHARRPPRCPPTARVELAPRSRRRLADASARSSAEVVRGGPGGQRAARRRPAARAGRPRRAGTGRRRRSTSPSWRLAPTPPSRRSAWRTRDAAPAAVRMRGQRRCWRHCSGSSQRAGGVDGEHGRPPSARRRAEVPADGGSRPSSTAG